MNKIIKNLLKAVGVVCYFIVLSFAYTRINLDRLVTDIEVFSGAFLVLGILALEKSYKDENGSLAITGIELLVLSMHSLSIMHVIALFKCDFKTYMGISSIVAVVYYLFKGIISYTKERREYLKGLSDISEIVKEEEPVKKEAKKRNVEKSEEKVQSKQEQEVKSKNKTQNKKHKKTSKTKSRNNEEKNIEKKTKNQEKESKKNKSQKQEKNTKNSKNSKDSKDSEKVTVKKSKKVNKKK